MSRSWWIIDIADYGHFPFFGTEEEADDRRCAKAAYEGRRSSMRSAMKSDQPMIDEEIRSLRWQHREGCELESNELEAIKQC